MTDELIIRLIEDLDRPWQTEVQSTIHALASMGPTVVPPLVRAIENGGAQLGHHAALVLHQMKAREALPSLIELLRDGHIHKENQAALIGIVIEMMEKDQPIPHMLGFLLRLSRELDAELRKLAASGLGKYHSPEVLPVLHRLSRDMVAMVSAEARSQLSQFPDEFDDQKLPGLDLSALAAAARLQEGDLPHTNGHQNGNGSRPLDPQAILARIPNAGPGTLEEVTPILKQLNFKEANGPLSVLLLDEKNAPHRRTAALESLYDLNDELEFMRPLFETLLQDPIPAMRIAALRGFHKLEVDSLTTILGEQLSDPDEQVKAEAAFLLAENIQPSDKSCLRYILDVLHDFPKGEPRLQLFRSLLCLIGDGGGNPFLLPEIQELLHDAELSELPVLLQVLKKLVLGKPLSTLSEQLLTLLERELDQASQALVIELLLSVMPRNFTAASLPLIGLFKVVETSELREHILSLLGRVADQQAVGFLIMLAHSSSHLELSVYCEKASKVLDSLEGSLREVFRDEEGRYQQRPGLPCLCGGRLQWEQRGRVEELRCQECQREFVLIAAYTPIPIEEATAPLCFCSECTRKQVLTRISEGYYYCFHSGRSYTVSAKDQTLLLVSELEHGVCRCCQPPQPMELQGERLVCSQTGKSADELRAEEANALPPVETGNFAVSASDGSGGHAVRRPTPSPPVRSFRLRSKLLAKHNDLDDDLDG
ncbi:MAG TPA: hypothetical protein DCE42_00185 [Myxococcales bacterium]|nr:hypothetical protein [Deltaproteobacteria bacterium]HAA53138.1 hypothetical protein [Myxococcales bacterium]|tara:strand:+ start:4020 stop:6149 length:2130 start_codon:yes stop_codon:yes gene_type:complete